MDKFRFWKMVSYSRKIITKPFESTLELKDEGGLSHAVKYISIVTLIKFIFPILTMFVGVLITSSVPEVMGVILMVVFLTVIGGALLLIAIILLEPIKMLVFSFVFQRLCGLRGSTETFRKLVYSFALFWAPWTLFAGLLSIISYIVPRGDIDNALQPINLILLLAKAAIMYYYFSRIGMAVTELPHRKIVFPTVSSIALVLLLEKVMSFLIESRIMNGIGQIHIYS